MTPWERWGRRWHELFLFGGAKGDPYDLNPGGVEFPGNGPVVELFCRKGSSMKGMAATAGFPRGDGSRRLCRSLCIAAQKGHAVIARAPRIPEDLRPTVMGTADAVKSSAGRLEARKSCRRWITGLRQPSGGSLHSGARGRGYWRPPRRYSRSCPERRLADFAVYRLRVEFIANVEEGFHLRQGGGW